MRSINKRVCDSAKELETATKRKKDKASVRGAVPGRQYTIKRTDHTWDEVVGDFEVPQLVRDEMLRALEHQMVMRLQQLPHGALVVLEERLAEPEAADALYEVLADTHQDHEIIKLDGFGTWILNGYGAVFLDAAA